LRLSPEMTANLLLLLHCTLAAVQCIVIGPVCVWVGVFVCVCVGVGGSVTQLHASNLTKLGL